MKAVISPKHILAAWSFLSALAPKKADPDNSVIFTVDVERKILYLNDILNTLNIWIPLVTSTQLSLIEKTTVPGSVSGGFTLDLRSLPKISLTVKNLDTSDVCELTPDSFTIASFSVNLTTTPAELCNFLLPNIPLEDEALLNSKYYLKEFAEALNKLPSPDLYFYEGKLVSTSDTRYYEAPGSTLPINTSGPLNFSINVQLYKRLTTYFSEFVQDCRESALIFMETSEKFYISLGFSFSTDKDIPPIYNYLEALSYQVPTLSFRVSDPKKLFADFKATKSSVGKEDDAVEVWVDEDGQLCFRAYDFKSVSAETRSVKVELAEGSIENFERKLYLLSSDLLSVLDLYKTQTYIQVESFKGQSVIQFTCAYGKKSVLIPLLVA
jgi:hypothetical protein